VLALVETCQGQGAELLELGRVPEDAAEHFLRGLDGDRLVALWDAPATQLRETWRLTDGNPQALKAVYKNL
jgi:hypothetical protein